MAEKSDVCKGPSVIWKTEKAYDDKSRESSVFSMLGTKWRLAMRTAISYDRKVPCSTITIRLLRIGCIETQRKFSAITSLQITRDMNTSYSCFDALGRKTTITSDNLILLQCEVEIASMKIYSFKDCTELTVICTFTDIPSSMFGILNETVEVTTQTDCDILFPLKTLHNDKLSSGESEQRASCISSNLDSLSQDLSKLLEEKVLPDIILRCGDRTAAAHSAVLAARSKVFSAMFQSQMSESEMCAVEISDIDVQVLELFLKYLYTGRLFASSHEDLLNLYAAGEKYAVAGLTMDVLNI